MLEHDIPEATILIRNIQKIEKSVATLRKQIERKIKPKQPKQNSCCCCSLEIALRRSQRANSFESINESEAQNGPITMQPYAGNYTPPNYETSYAPEGVDSPIYSQPNTSANELTARTIYRI